MMIFAESLINSRGGENKDRYFIDLDRNIFVICDGISTCDMGGESAQFAVDYIEKCKFPDRIDEKFALNIINEMNREICKMNGGTTFTLLRIENDEGVLIHTGDSECYKIKNGQIEELTTPFTAAYGRYLAGNLELKDVKRAKYSNVLMESLGQTPINPQLKRFKITKSFTHFILNSDGANFCLPEEMLFLLKEKQPARSIALKAKEKGSTDDITTIVIDL